MCTRHGIMVTRSRGNRALLPCASREKSHGVALLYSECLRLEHVCPVSSSLLGTAGATDRGPTEGDPRNLGLHMAFRGGCQGEPDCGLLVHVIWDILVPLQRVLHEVAASAQHGGSSIWQHRC